MKAIFLDIDGVLNSTSWYRKVRSTSWEWHNMAGKYITYSIDQNAVRLLDYIITNTEAKIVLSSSWRLGPPLPVLKADFLKVNIDIYDKTPCWGKLGVMDWEPVVDEDGHPHLKQIPRGEIVNAYLAKHPEVTSYVILDDVDQFTEEQHKHLILTNEEVGLTKEDADKAIIILNNC